MGARQFVSEGGGSWSHTNVMVFGVPVRSDVAKELRERSLDMELMTEVNDKISKIITTFLDKHVVNGNDKLSSTEGAS